MRERDPMEKSAPIRVSDGHDAQIISPVDSARADIILKAATS